MTRRSFRPFLWVLLALGVVMFLGVTAVGVGWMVQRARRPDPGAFVPPDRSAERQEAAAVFRDPTPPDPEQTKEFTRFFDQLAAALADPAADVTGFFDTDRMIDELDRLGAFKASGLRADARSRQAFKTGARQSLTANLRTNWAALRWKTTDVRRVTAAADGSEVVVFAVHTGEDGTRYKMRWWLVRRPGGWAIYDMEDLDGGVRGMHAAATAMAAAAGDPARMHEFRKLQNIPQAIQAVIAGDLPAARKLLDECRGIDFPGPLGDLHEIAESVYELNVGQSASARGRLDRIIARNPDMPVAFALRSAALNQLGEYEPAVKDANHYLEQLGPVAEALAHLGFAYEGLERREDALAAYRRALDDDPANLDSLLGLRRTLPDPHKREVAERFARAPKPHDLYDELVLAAREDDDRFVVEAVAAALYLRRPADPRGPSELIRTRADAGLTADATALYRAASETVRGAEDRDMVRNALLWALAARDEHQRAYAAVPDADAVAAFRVLAGDLDGRLSDFTDEGAKPDDEELKAADAALDRLLASHRKRVPGDFWPTFYEGSRFMRAKDFAAADRKLAEGMAKLRFTGDPDADWKSGYMLFRGERVEAKYRLGEGMTAYRDLRPADVTFVQLAWLYRNDQDAKGLQALIDAHRKANPKDPVADYWQAQVYWDKKAYEEAVRHLRRYLAAVSGDTPGKFSQYQWSANDQIVRGLVHLNRPADARAHLDGMGETAPVALRALVLAAAGDHGAARSLLAETAEKESWRVVGFYADPDLGPVLKRDEYRAFRDKFPPPTPPADDDD